MTNIILLKPSLSISAPSDAYILANGLDLEREPIYPIKMQISSNSGQSIRRFILEWQGITHTKKQSFENDFDRNKNIGRCYVHDVDGDLVFLGYNTIAVFLISASYTWTEGNFWNINATFKEEIN